MDKKKTDFVVELSTHLDNVSGELLGHAAAEILAGGALDFAIFPITMKKGRPGFALKVLATPEKASSVESLIFSQLPTLGVRRKLVERSILDRCETEIQTESGPVKAKKIFELDGTERTVAEFDELVRLARQSSQSLRKIKISSD